MSEENNTALGENADVESEQSKSYKTYDGAPRLDELDRKILKLITGNARIAFLEVARMCGVSGAAIHQRVQRLMNIGVIKGSEFILSPSKIGYQACAFVGVFLREAGSFNQVVAAMEKIPEIVECHYTTGRYAIFIKIYARNNEHMKYVLADCIQQIPGIASTETIISLEETFKRQIEIE